MPRAHSTKARSPTHNLWVEKFGRSYSLSLLTGSNVRSIYKHEGIILSTRGPPHMYILIRMSPLPFAYFHVKKGVENGAARYTPLIHPLLLISGSALVCGFRYALRNQAYGSGFEHRFVFGCALRIRAWVCLRRLALASGIRFGFERFVWTFGKASRMQKCEIDLGSCSFGKAGRKAEVL